MARQSVQADETTTKFEVDWPNDLKIDPIYTVKVSKGVTARVFKAIEYDYVSDGTKVGGTVERSYEVYKVVYRSDKTGKRPKRMEEWDFRENVYRSLLGVRLELEMAAAALLPVKKTVKTDADPED